MEGRREGAGERERESEPPLPEAELKGEKLKAENPDDGSRAPVR